MLTKNVLLVRFAFAQLKVYFCLASQDTGVLILRETVHINLTGIFVYFGQQVVLSSSAS